MRSPPASDLAASPSSTPSKRTRRRSAWGRTVAITSARSSPSRLQVKAAPETKRSGKSVAGSTETSPAIPCGRRTIPTRSIAGTLAASVTGSSVPDPDDDLLAPRGGGRADERAQSPDGPAVPADQTPPLRLRHRDLVNGRASVGGLGDLSLLRAVRKPSDDGFDQPAHVTRPSSPAPSGRGGT